MKKQLLLLTLLFPLLGACADTYEYTPRIPYPGSDDTSESEDDKGDEGGDDGDKIPMTVNFYYDYAHSETPFLSFPVIDNQSTYHMLEPLGSLPEGAELTDADAKDPLYPHFIGYSRFSSCLDEGKLWDFANDYYQGSTLDLYGIWVSQ